MENRLDIDAPVVLEQTVTKDDSAGHGQARPYPFPVIETEDNLSFLARVPDETVQLIIISPP